MIVLCRNFRRVVLELITPSIAGVYINRIAITVQFPHSGNLQIIPAFVIETYFPEVGRTLVGIAYPREFPGTVQSHVISRLGFLALHGGICRFIGKVISVHGSTVHGIDFRIKPLFKGLCICSQSQGCKESGNKMFLHGYKISMFVAVRRIFSAYRYKDRVNELFLGGIIVQKRGNRVQRATVSGTLRTNVVQVSVSEIALLPVPDVHGEQSLPDPAYLLCANCHSVSKCRNRQPTDVSSNH